MKTNKKIDNNNINNTSISINNKTMGRKPKISGSKTSTRIKKKVTPKKSVTKKRGQRNNKILENNEYSSDVDSCDETKRNSTVIIGLPLNIEDFAKKSKQDSKIDPKKKSKSVSTKTKKSVKLDISSDDDTVNYNYKKSLVDENFCHKCVKNEKVISIMKSKLDKYQKKEQDDKVNKLHINKLKFISVSTGNKMKLRPTSIRCWWDTHTFTGLPCVLPENYHNDTYYVQGCFCSFNCALAYNLYYIKDNRTHHRISLTYKLYREMYDIDSDKHLEIKEAPRREILEDYGGDTTIDVFRKKFIMLEKEIVVYIPPMRPINIIMEERSNSNDYDNGEDYVLKRNKPLSKGGSIISSMILRETSSE